MTRSIVTSLATWIAAWPAAADPSPAAAHPPPAAADPAPAAAPPSTTAFPVSPYEPTGAPAPSSAAPAAAAADYGHAGDLELGGAFGVTVASDVRDVSLALMFGRFVAERFELSANAGVANLKAGERSATLWSALVEPSYHLPLAPSAFGVLGMGVGIAYVHQLGTGLAVAPRIGVSFRVGRWGLVTPALAYAYVTHRALDRHADLAVLAVTGALRIQLGYAATW